MTTTEWARANGVEYAWWCNLDNHEPPRATASGTLWTYVTNTFEHGIVIDDHTVLRDARSSMFAVDDGRDVRPYFVAGSGGLEGQTHMMLHRFPTNVHDDGTPRLRVDDHRPVDYSNWALGPRRCYHLKVRRK